MFCDADTDSQSYVTEQVDRRTAGTTPLRDAGMASVKIIAPYDLAQVSELPLSTDMAAVNTPRPASSPPPY
jgi:hypothetical protein|eukprot:COSAG01_NODE_40723_length_460_cov_1.138504_1_plen_71_part_00